jgi:SAM-dependent methyltransferase
MSDEQRPAGWADDERVRRWIEGAAQRERQMVSMTEELFAAADLQPGEAALDVGCGTGPTTLEAAAAVGPTGYVIGTDIAPPMIATARQIAAARPQGVAPQWLVADAQTHDLGAGRFDVVLSRCGVMFFPDPVAAFANLLRATRPGGRLVAVVWQTREHVPFFEIPYVTATRVLTELGLTYEPVAPDDNQCSLGTPERVREVLEPAGWVEVQAHPTDRTMYLGGEQSPAEAARDSLDAGPIRGVLDGRSEEIRERVRAALEHELSPHFDGTGVLLPAGFMVVTARRPC